MAVPEVTALAVIDHDRRAMGGHLHPGLYRGGLDRRKHLLAA